MCGISGLYYFDRHRHVDESLLIGMREVAAHRGSDDHGLYLSRNVGFAFNRLSIIDIEGGSQPMSNDDRTVWLIFNGEIYNFVELRSELIRAGHRFRTRSDTETVLRAWEEYGADCVQRFRGMFAFAIWDERRRLLFAARDRVGIKPLYYYADKEQFAFASEIKSLLEVPEIPTGVDTAALADYLRHGYVLGPNTLFPNIRKLPPAHSVTVQRNHINVQRYWEVPLQDPKDMTEREALEEFGPLLDETVRMHMVSDVPLGVFLSGGLDSSSIVAVASRLSPRHIKTFSIGYDSSESELGYARIVAQHCSTEHHEMRLTPSAFRDCLPHMVWHMDEPLADAPSIPLYFLSQFARRQVTVALSGEGSDEILGGYPTYNRMLAVDRLNRVPFARAIGRVCEHWAPQGKIRKNAAMLGRPLESRYRTAVIFAVQQIEQLMRDVLPVEVDDPYRTLAQAHARCQKFPTLTRMSYVDLTTWLPDDLLMKADRMSMAHSLELRVPFLDHKVIEFCAQLPLDLKIRRGVNKYLLKRLMKPVLPSRILRRAKRGFSIPTKRWFRGALAEFVREKLLAADGACNTFFARSEILRILEAHNHRDCADQIYALLVFDEWHRTFIQRPRAAPQLQRRVPKIVL
jgi:asparagine synthase (glutamine-hydrolysing)